MRSEEPVYIIEVGAGHGKLAFLILTELARPHIRERLRSAGITYKYVMTDFAAGNVAFWDTHARLKPFFEAGVLDSAVFNAETDTSLTLTHAGTTLRPGSCSQPVVAICNYIFDTLRQDAFRVVEGMLQLAMAAVYTDKEEEDPTHPDIIRRMRVVWDYRPCTPEIYKSPALQTALRVYLARTANASILVPIGGITAMSNIAALSGGKIMLLCGDKAYSHEEELAGIRDPHVAVHGSFSFMVNFHAVRLYALAKGGFALQTPLMDGFKCGAFVIGMPAAGQTAAPAPPGGSLPLEQMLTLCEQVITDATLGCPELLCSWADVMDTFGPDNFSNLQRCVRDELPNPSLKTALATLRLSCWDSDVFYKFKHIIIDATPKASEKQQQDIARDMVAVAERYYPLQTSKDVSFDLGRVCMGLKRYQDAITYFRASRGECGDHHVSWYNEGICYWYLADWKQAHACFSKSVEMRPDYADAATWRTRVEAKMQGEAFVRAATGPTQVSPSTSADTSSNGSGTTPAAGTQAS